MPEATPWFPRKKSDLDSFAEKVLSYGTDLNSDHPGFKDAAYRQRRADITAIARTHRQYSLAFSKPYGTAAANRFQ
jgi:phenylalanine-4-hydroxylase